MYRYIVRDTADIMINQLDDSVIPTARRDGLHSDARTIHRAICKTNSAGKLLLVGGADSNPAHEEQDKNNHEDDDQDAG